MNTDDLKKPRTPSQNASLHLYLTWKAEQLNEHGITLQDITERIKKAEITPTMENLKEVVWKPLQKALYNKQSTTQLEVQEVDKVHEIMEAFLNREFETEFVPWPSRDLVLTKEEWSRIMGNEDE